MPNEEFYIKDPSHLKLPKMVPGDQIIVHNLSAGDITIDTWPPTLLKPGESWTNDAKGDA